jgi:hypothetical protein
MPLIRPSATFSPLSRGEGSDGDRRCHPRLKVSANAITVFVPLSDLKGQRIRLVIGVEG